MGRNIALAVEFNAPRRGLPWRKEFLELEQAPGTYWSEKRKLEQTVKESFARNEVMFRASGLSKQCTKPLDQPPRSLTDLRWAGPRH